MPEKKTVERARKAEHEGKAPTTQAGEFVREEIHHVRRGKHGARSPKQAIAIGLSKARRAGVKVPPPKKGQAQEKTRQSAERATEEGRAARRGRATAQRKPSPRRSRAVKGALQREGRKAVSSGALSRQAKKSRPTRKTGPTRRPKRAPRSDTRRAGGARAR